MAFNRQGGLGTGTILNFDRVFTTRRAFVMISIKDGTFMVSRKIKP